MGILSRLSHRHYLINFLICLPLPAFILRQAFQDVANGWVYVLPLIFLPLMVYSSKWTTPEGLLEKAFFNFQIFNLAGIYLLTDKGLRYAIYYALAWFLVSFFFPQPNFLGASRINYLNSETFDTQILLIPASKNLMDMLDPENPPQSSSSLPESGITEIKEGEDLPPAREDEPVTTDQAELKEVWNVVLFYASWSRRCRNLAITLADMSNTLLSPTLKFHILDVDESPTTSYDFDISASPTSLSLPTIILFHGGKEIDRLPKAERNELDSDGEEDDEGIEGVRRDAEEKLARLRWDGDPTSIVESFRLRERCLLESPGEQRQSTAMQSSKALVSKLK